MQKRTISGLYSSLIAITSLIPLFVIPIQTFAQAVYVPPAVSTSSAAGSLTVNPLASPAGLSAAVFGTPGTTTYYYVVTAVSGTGETLASNEVSVTTANATLSASNYVQLAWTFVAGAKSYNVYRSSTTGTELKIASTVLASYSDISSTVGVGSLPLANTTGALNADGANINVADLKANGIIVNMPSASTGFALKASVPINSPTLQFATPSNAFANADLTQKTGLGANTNDLWIEGANRIVLNPTYAVTYETPYSEYLQGISWAMNGKQIVLSGVSNFQIQTNIVAVNVLTMGSNQDTILTPFSAAYAVVLREQSGQTRNLLELQSSTNAVLTSVNPAGIVIAPAFASAVRTVTAATDTATASDSAVEVNSTVAETETLPTPSTVKGQRFTLIDLTANSVSVSNAVLGSPSTTLAAIGASETFLSDGSTYILVH